MQVAQRMLPVVSDDWLFEQRHWQTNRKNRLSKWTIDPGRLSSFLAKDYRLDYSWFVSVQLTGEGSLNDYSTTLSIDSERTELTELKPRGPSSKKFCACVEKFLNSTVSNYTLFLVWLIHTGSHAFELYCNTSRVFVFICVIKGSNQK